MTDTPPWYKSAGNATGCPEYILGARTATGASPARPTFSRILMLKSAALTLALLAAGASAVGAQSATTTYVPGTHRYRVTREAKSSQEMMGQTQSGTVSTFEEFTLDLRPGGRDSMRFTVTIDSAAHRTDLPTPGAPPERKGRKVSGVMSTSGVFHQFDKDATETEEFSSAYRNFLPKLPAGGVKAGMAWTDTVRAPFSQGGIEGTTISTIASRVLGDTTLAGQKAWRIERTGTLSMSGTGHQSGADLILSGSGTANGVSYVAVGGTYLGATSTQELSMNIEVPAASMTIPIKQTTVTKIEKVAGPTRTP